ncbi:MAG: 3-hydroxyacyl-CoA dehydrogenase [Rhodospirillaceae bacterium]|nr:3-hydroxyacyl-CoA dehydrogenase [Rhodospirillaceae bacterium]
MDRNVKVTLIGAGLMGHALALVHAIGGHQVRIQDASSSQLDKSVELINSALGTMVDSGVVQSTKSHEIQARIMPVIALADAVDGAGLIIEAVVENADVKRQVYAEIDAAAPADVILASNTSHLNVFPLIPEARQKRSLISHWYTPPYVIDLVDLAPGPDTDPEVMRQMKALYDGMGKKPVLFDKFIPGYVANRLQAAMGLEITKLLDEGWVSAKSIDDSIKYGLALRMALMGVLMKADFTGLDMMRRGMANRTYVPPVPTPESPTLNKLLVEGKQGVMSGAGYFEYGGRSPEELFRNRDIGLLRLKAEVARIEDELPLGG